jgi:hypothetical protein
MMVSLARSDRDLDEGARFALTAQPGGVLGYESALGAGVQLGVDLMAPDRWCSVSFPPRDTIAQPLVAALIGECAARNLDALAAERVDRAPCSLPADVDAALPWIRVAVVDALDRWLQLPLDQSLVDAERALSRSAAARTLPVRATARSVVVGEALQLARQASGGVVRYMRDLATRRALPSGLLRAMRRLAEGYADLVDEVAGPDRTLAAVLDVWQGLDDRSPVDDQPDRTPTPTGDRLRLPSRGGLPASMIDPRQVRARILALSADPAAGEVTKADTRVGDGPGVLVRVPAYRRALDPAVIHRLLVRLVDARSADPQGQSVLTVSRAGHRRVYFEGIVPVGEAGAERLRADVFDALSDVPPVSADTDRELQEVRRATVLLSEWRRLVAIAQLSAPGSAPGNHLRALARRLAPGGPADVPLFPTGPSPADLVALAEAGDHELLRRASAADVADDGAKDLFATVRDTGALLAAEIAAADSDRNA